MTIAQLLPADAATEAAEALAGLAGAGSGPLDDAFFARDWTPLWDELAGAGWTAVADGPAAGRDGDLTLLDLAALAERWGRLLMPLPLVETLVVRRWLDERPAPAVPLTYAVGGLAPFGATCSLFGAGRAEVREVDAFADSLPIAVLAAPPAGGSPRMRGEIAALCAALAAGASGEVLARSVAYATARHQFGRPVGSFQAVKHRLADMHCRVELARSAVAWACAEPLAPERPALHAVDLCLRVCEDAVQVHGGIGFTWEAPVHRFLRQVMSLRRLVAPASPTPALPPGGRESSETGRPAPR